MNQNTLNYFSQGHNSIQIAFPRPITTTVPKSFHKIRILDQSLDYAIAHSTSNPRIIRHEFPLEDPTNGSHSQNIKYVVSQIEEFQAEFLLEQKPLRFILQIPLCLASFSPTPQHMSKPSLSMQQKLEKTKFAPRTFFS